MKSIFSTGRRALMALTACVALLLMGGSAFAQSLIKGKVLDSKGEPIIGAAVLVPGTTTGAVTDIDGNFEIRVTPGTALEASCIGYVTKTVSAAANMTITRRRQPPARGSRRRRLRYHEEERRDRRHGLRQLR